MLKNIPAMTIAEHAALEEQAGARVRHSGGIWWRQVRPFFYRPVHLFLRAEPEKASPPAGSVLAGYQHLVTGEKGANSKMNFIVTDNTGEYSISSIASKYRRAIRKSARHLEIRRISDPAEFIDAGHPVYLEFFARTQYRWKRERENKESFAAWAGVLVQSPKVLVFGLYHEGILCCINVAYSVEDVIYYSSSFSNSTGLRFNAPEYSLHLIREFAAECRGAQMVFMGIAGSKGSLDDFKLRRGCRRSSEPAYYRMNPITLLLIRILRPDYARRLRGV
ncbi:MAG TPA: hypothetical protein PK587_08130 [Syntrophales bacterium]|nr:hypothetical protein [Syntrophales bacterium]